MKKKHKNRLAALFGEEFTYQVALRELDMKTKLLLHQDANGLPFAKMLLRTQKPLPTELQWYTVATISHIPLSPVTLLWLALKPNAVPFLVLRSYARDIAIYITERAFPVSATAWRIVRCLDFNAGVVQLRALEELDAARGWARSMQAGASNENIRLAAVALEEAANDDALKAAIGVSEAAVLATRALRVPDDGSVVTALARKMSRLCTKALEQHPQKDVLKAQI